MNSRYILNAARDGNLARVKALVASGVSVNSRDRFGRTPLHWACQNGHLEVVQYLKQQGADINARGNDGRTPLHGACEKGHLAMVQYLKEQGADMNAKNRDGRTPLHLACEKGHLEVVQYLKEQGADINATDNIGRTPLRFASGNGHLSVVQYLEEQGADINATDNYGWTPLHRACAFGHLAVVQYLVEQGADLNAKNKDGWTPLHFACQNGYLAVVKCLMEQGADINAQDNDGWIPLHWACQNGHLAVVQYLRKQGADMYAKSNDGWTPLHRACWIGHLEMVQYLVEQGAEINAKDKRGRTALDVSRDDRIGTLLRGATASQACAGVPPETSSSSSATTLDTHQQAAPPSSQQHTSALSSGVATASSGDKQTPCAFFAVGKCNFGSRCRFLHISPPPDSMPVAVAAPQSPLADPSPQQTPVAVTADSNRFVSTGRTEDGELRGLLRTMFPVDLSLLPLLDSLKPIMASHPDIDIARQVKLAEKKAAKLAGKYGTLSSHERAAIVLYTMEAIPRETSVYFMVNAALRKVDRQAVRPWRDYIWLLLHALHKLPAIAMDTNLYRGMKVRMADLGDAYVEGSEFQWAGFSSTSLRLGVMQSDDFLGRSGSRVLFNLKLTEPVGRDISDFSLYREAEILLPPNMLFEVTDVLDAGNDLHILQCEQTQSLDMLLYF